MHSIQRHLVETILAVLALSLLTSVPVSGQSVPNSAKTQPATGDEVAVQQERFDRWKSELPSGSGPYQVARLEPETMPGFTIFLPKSLSNMKGRLPLLVFANGGCRNTPIEFTAFLSEIASHGYAIVAVGRDDVPFLGMPIVGPPSDKLLQNLDPQVLIHAIDQAIAENRKEKGVFEGRLDLRHIAVAGQSCGGLQALAAATDTRVKTALVLNSGAFVVTPPGLKLVRLEDLKSLTLPLAYFIGGPTDMAFANAKANFDVITHAPVFMANLPVGHVGAYPAPDLRWSAAIIDWLDWQLKGNRVAATSFRGQDCKLCKDRQWTVDKKLIR